MDAKHIVIFKAFLSQKNSYDKVGRQFDISGTRVDQIIKKVCRDLFRLSFSGKIELPLKPKKDKYYSTTELRNNGVCFLQLLNNVYLQDGTVNIILPHERIRPLIVNIDIQN